VPKGHGASLGDCFAIWCQYLFQVQSTPVKRDFLKRDVRLSRTFSCDIWICSQVSLFNRDYGTLSGISHFFYQGCIVAFWGLKLDYQGCVAALWHLITSQSSRRSCFAIIKPRSRRMGGSSPTRMWSRTARKRSIKLPAAVSSVEFGQPEHSGSMPGPWQANSDPRCSLAGIEGSAADVAPPGGWMDSHSARIV